MRWVEHVARMENRRGTHKALVGKPEGKRRHGNPRCGWKGNIKLIFKKWNRDMDWVDQCKDWWSFF